MRFVEGVQDTQMTSPFFWDKGDIQGCVLYVTEFYIHVFVNAFVTGKPGWLHMCDIKFVSFVG